MCGSGVWCMACNVVVRSGVFVVCGVLCARNAGWCWHGMSPHAYVANVFADCRLLFVL